MLAKQAYFVFLNPILFLFCSAGDQTKNFVHARRVLCYWAVSPPPSFPTEFDGIKYSQLVWNCYYLK
jgi:hypothetical protein